MRIVLNDTEVNVPSSLSEITLGQRIAFQEAHGDVINQMEASLKDIPDELDREIEQTQVNLEKMFRTMSFFMDCTVEALKDKAVINQVIAIYSATMDRVFADEQREIENPKYEFVWNHEEWELHEPQLRHGDPMTFGEFIDSKQTVQNMIQLSKNRWECLLPLCAIFLRKKGEPYQESFLYEGSERLKLLQDLPLDIALQVGFFLSSSLSSYTEASPYFFQDAQKARESLLQSTSDNLAG